ncbi:hypothetical protein FOVSG1_013508 [Fusarium oxysporum f. sp. vasinfectum]
MGTLPKGCIYDALFKHCMRGGDRIRRNIVSIQNKFGRPKLTEAKVWSQFYQNYNPDYKISTKTFGDPSNRKIRVINIGAGLFGLFGINLAYWISVKCQNFDLTAFEKSGELGGVWNHNRYPGVACDVPSHVYQYSFAPNPDWPRFLSPGKDIHKYLQKCATTFDLVKYIKFQATVLKAEWHEEGFWRVFVSEKLPNGEHRDYHQDAEILVNNCGSQHNYQWPDVEGLDKFKGTLLHTAAWDERFNQDAWKDKTVCLIGSGASAVQVVPGIQPHVPKMTVFSRTPVWFPPGLAGNDFSPECFTPEFVPGCRRVTPGDPFINAIQEPNVEVVFKGVTKLTEDGVIDSDGVERKCDVVVCATGFNVNLIPLFEVIGPNGIEMSKVLEQTPDSYMSVALAQFPNLFYGSTGAYWPSANGSLIGPMDAVANYVVQVIQKLQMEHNIISLVPKQEAMEDFAQHTQTWMKGAAWSWDCPSWYKAQSGPLKGRVNVIWPGITLQFVRVLEKVRWEDYDIRYAATGKTSANRFFYLGDGLVKETFDAEMDDTPHINLGAIDPRWAKAAGLTFVEGMRPLVEPLVNGNGKVAVNGA